MAAWFEVGRGGDQASDLLGAQDDRRLRGTATCVILSISSGQPSVMSKKNFSPVMVALMVTGPVPVSTRCS